VFAKLILLADLFWLQKITTDPHILAVINIVCPENKEPKFKIYISELILDSHEYIPVACVTIHCILIYIQQDATLHSLFYLETALHVSGCTTIHHQERKQLYLQHLVLVTPLLLPATIVEELEPV